ncbi:MAG: Bacterial SH3 domain [Rhodobacteraceae bacterium HLUCCA08]|nr:MAG: Bacterial SH3 domain [Rhodobacteraceae bacterium HLUCCA08]
MRGMAICLMFGGGMAAADITVYECEAHGDGHYEISVDSAAPDRAQAVYVPGGEYGEAPMEFPLEAVPVASGFGYAGDDVRFRGKGMVEAELTEGAVRLRCLAGGWPVGPVPAVSSGGRLRDGPGLEFRIIDTLAPGSAVEIVLNTRRFHDGYEWLELRLPDGRSGYHWGGLVCLSGAYLPGTTGPCRAIR